MPAITRAGLAAGAEFIKRFDDIAATLLAAGSGRFAADDELGEHRSIGMFDQFIHILAVAPSEPAGQGAPAQQHMGFARTVFNSDSRPCPSRVLCKSTSASSRIKPHRNPFSTAQCRHRLQRLPLPGDHGKLSPMSGLAGVFQRIQPDQFGQCQLDFAEYMRPAFRGYAPDLELKCPARQIRRRPAPRGGHD